MKRYSMYRLYLILALVLAATLACRLVTRQAPSPAVRDQGQDALSNVTIQVSAREFEFALDTDQVKPGKVTFSVRNDGNMPHDFAISGRQVDQKTHMLDSGETDTIEVDLAPGTYEYSCTIPGHARLGMQGTLTVTQ